VRILAALGVFGGVLLLLPLAANVWLAVLGWPDLRVIPNLILAVLLALLGVSMIVRSWRRLGITDA
jgi:hypothetical protein